VDRYWQARVVVRGFFDRQQRMQLLYRPKDDESQRFVWNPLLWLSLTQAEPWSDLSHPLHLHYGIETLVPAADAERSWRSSEDGPTLLGREHWVQRNFVKGMLERITLPPETVARMYNRDQALQQRLDVALMDFTKYRDAVLQKEDLVSKTGDELRRLQKQMVEELQKRQALVRELLETAVALSLKETVHSDAIERGVAVALKEFQGEELGRLNLFLDQLLVERIAALQSTDQLIQTKRELEVEGAAREDATQQLAAERRLEAARRDRESLLAGLTSLQDALEATRRARDRVTKQLEANLADMEAIRKAREEENRHHRDDLVRVQRERDDLARDTESLTLRLRRLENERDASDRRESDLRNFIRRMAEESGKLRAELASVRQDRDRVTRILAGERDDRAAEHLEANRREDELEDEIATLRSQAEEQIRNLRTEARDREDRLSDELLGLQQTLAESQARGLRLEGEILASRGEVYRQKGQKRLARQELRAAEDELDALRRDYDHLRDDILAQQRKYLEWIDQAREPQALRLALVSHRPFHPPLPLAPIIDERRSEDEHRPRPTTSRLASAAASIGESTEMGTAREMVNHFDRVFLRFVEALDGDADVLGDESVAQRDRMAQFVTRILRHSQRRHVLVIVRGQTGLPIYLASEEQGGARTYQNIGQHEAFAELREVRDRRTDDPAEQAKHWRQVAPYTPSVTAFTTTGAGLTLQPSAHYYCAQQRGFEGQTEPAPYALVPRRGYVLVSDALPYGRGATFAYGVKRAEAARVSLQGVMPAAHFEMHLERYGPWLDDTCLLVHLAIEPPSSN
jgi:hypothetical protein